MSANIAEMEKRREAARVGGGQKRIDSAVDAASMSCPRPLRSGDLRLVSTQR